MRSKRERSRQTAFRYQGTSTGGKSCARCTWYTGDQSRKCEALSIKVDPGGTCNAWCPKLPGDAP